MQKTESQQMKNHHNWKRTVFFCLLIKIVWVGFTPRLTTAILFPMATESNSLWSEVDIRPTKDPILFSAFFFSFWFHRCGFWFFLAFPHEIFLHASRTESTSLLCSNGFQHTCKLKSKLSNFMFDRSSASWFLFYSTNQATDNNFPA